jgi:hypothetical protein
MFYMKYTETFLKVDSLMALYRYPTVQPKLLVFFFLKFHENLAIYHLL